MSLFGKVKGNIQQTAALARDGVEELQVKRELGQAYAELGRRVYALIGSGQLQVGGLGGEVERIRRLEQRLADEGDDREAAYTDPGITGPGEETNRVGGPL